MTRSEVSGGGPAVRSRYQQGATTQQSRLEMLQADFQQKLMREKEEKMVHVYEENQQRTLERLNNRQNNGSLNRGGSVREFFKERRALEAQNKGGVPPIHQHYSQYQNSPSGSAKTHYSMSSRMSGASHTSGQSSYSTGSNWSAPQPGYRNSAGRDRAKPLAPLTQKPGPPSPPIDTVNKHAPVPPIQQKPRIYQRKPGGPGNSDRDGNGNRIYRGQVYQGANSAQTNGSLGDYEDEDSSPSPPDQRKTGRRPANPARRPPGNNNPSSGSQSPQKLTNFQKWQLDQNQAREERLQRNKRNPSGSRVSDGMEADEDDSGIDLNDEIRRRKDEIQARLEQQQADLRRIQLQREQDEEKERQKRARKERAQQDRHRRMEEQRERQRAAEEERQRLQQERRQAQEERRRAEERQHMEAEERQSRHSQGTYRHPDEDSMYAPSPRSQQPQRRTQPNKPRRAVHHERRQSLRAAANASRPDPEDELIPVPGPGIDIYAQAANDTEAFGPSVDLAPCNVCGRRFARDRLPKHQQACKTVSKQRKVFDPVKMRTEGTEAAQYVRSNRHQKQSESRKPKKSNWRAQHESFIQSIRYAKKMSDYEANGGKLSDLPPPPPSDTSDYVQCPHCNRRFNQSVAERHIPKCVNIRAKPRPPPNRRR